MAKQQEQRRHSGIEHPGGEETPIRFEQFSTDRLEQLARRLAQAQKNTKHKEGRKLIPRVQQNCRVLLDAYEAGSRYFCESFYGHPCPTSGKNYATTHAFGGPSRPASLVAYPT
ncbi:MAG: hypothetical protein PHG00_16425 [Methylococcales bacterium]|nr:hypothetical protein [Methylococcales bacterium]